ncbi:MAG TPA: enoyl-CoA hydratase-related protein [Candidatus Dormibacteraeota bacterium]|nr:enoyl-CoA hydratase-related protein [Candidatus Dormibacteraeota bacterium]
MELSCVLYETGDGVATVTLNRPERRNAMSTQLLGELLTALGAAKDDPEVRVVILTGAGDKAFCAGADLGGIATGAGPIQLHEERREFVKVFQLATRLGKPLIGCINGHALAGGFGLALSCDLLVAADTATFGTPEINVGLWPMMIMAIIGRNLPRKRAMELYMTGERIDAQTALSWGLVNRVVPLAEVRRTARDLALRLTEKSPLLMRLGRDAFFAIDDLDFESALTVLHSQLTVLTLSDDAAEGTRAFMEKRAPKFTGR